MRLGALIVTTGLRINAGVASLLSPSGHTTAGQRMIAAFQCCGVSCVSLVLEKGNKKAQRTFAQDGVIFFHTASPDVSTLEGAQIALRYLSDKFDRIFLVTGNQSLFLPETLRLLLARDADIVVPTYTQLNGCPVLLSNSVIKDILDSQSTSSLEQVIYSSSASKAFVNVNDPGILIQGCAEQNRKVLAEKQAKQLLRPTADIQIQIGNLYFDRKLSMLLHLIDETGSVRSASELMQVSYSTAWGMLNDADVALDDPLIIRKRGGPQGSGCTLSDTGRRVLNAYDQYCEAIRKKADTLYFEIFQDVLNEIIPYRNETHASFPSAFLSDIRFMKIE